ncbi:MMPL family transporter [Thalassobacillus hwangdonensis]|uniref:MMPL family transporter n=1 Tax=Thalassobacillus hwangdonensis TaxID=546108 RepID=A0ABW3L2D4_9BACI
MKFFYEKMLSKKGMFITLIIWLVALFALSGTAPGAKDFAVNTTGAGLPEDAASVIADKKMAEHFEDSGTLPAILVFQNKEAFDEEALTETASAIKGIDDLPAPEGDNVAGVLPFGMFPPEAQQSFLSENNTTLVIPVELKNELEMEEVNATINAMEEELNAQLSGTIDVAITGPAGIASDALELFSKADLVLLFSTIGLILVLLIVLYRSPLLAMIPLLASGIVYEVVNRTIGLAGKWELFSIESQALSIMMILLFAAITDYSLFVFSRFREELQVVENKYEAMKNAMTKVGEPIFFSGGTVLVAVLTLAVAIYEPYRSFAPVFAIAMVLILLAGLTLVPALFTFFGRKSFWPAIPKVNQSVRTSTIWEKISSFVTRKPLVTGLSVFIVMLIFSINAFNVSYSYNLLKSFPEDMSSREGFELIEENYTPGEVAPTTVLLTSEDGKIEKEAVEQLQEQLEKENLVAGVSINERQYLSEDERAAKLQLTFSENPYSEEAMDAMEDLRSNKENILSESGLNEGAYGLSFTGETATTLDTRTANDRDTLVVLTLVTVLITVMLGFQSRSIIAPIYMMATILLSFSAALGLSDWIFKGVFGYDQMSYRIPLYSFVFLVALGVDYNIMLVSRIKEYYKEHSLLESVRHGVTHTGGVISAAGLILAATFAVLTTQPIMELFMFGFVVAVGVLIDTFLVRTILTPAIILLLGKWSFWPGRK